MANDDGMSLFFAEVGPTRLTADDLPLLRAVLTTSSDRLASRGRPVRYVSATYDTEHGRLVCVFSAPDIDTIHEVLAAANLSAVQVERQHVAVATLTRQSAEA
jgi:hypothetical protein